MAAFRNKPRRADEHLKWLREVGEAIDETEAAPGSTHPDTRGIHLLIPALTGADYKALEAIDRAWTLFAYTRSTRVLDAIALLAAEMQESTRPLARELAARAMEWADRDRYWPYVVNAIRDWKQPWPSRLVQP